MDRISREQRSENMRRIRSKDTTPEIIVRRLLYRLGYRFRIHDHKFPGRPDIIFSRSNKAIFVHGCFWHQHQGCNIAREPLSNRAYWLPKLKRNKRRDRSNKVQLIGMGWKVLVVWECEVQDEGTLQAKLLSFLKRTTNSSPSKSRNRK